MAASLGYVLSQLQRWTSLRLGGLSDAELLERFVGQRDESAFAALVARHGGMVLRSCRRILGDSHAAEDAFQATFLVLAQRAHALRQPAALPGFLHTVARRVALKARAKAAVCTGNSPLTEEAADSHSDPLMQLTARELLKILDEEIARLPAAQRSALVLCCLEGHPREEAAHILGCTDGAIKGHLQRGRQRLQKRLRRRGIDLSAALALVLVAREGMAAHAPAVLLHSTVRAALHGGIGGTASALADSFLHMMFVPRLVGLLAVTLILAFAASTTIALVNRSREEAAEAQTPALPVAAKDAGETKELTRTDVPSDPLPKGAIARLGKQRLRHSGLIKFTAFTLDGKRLVSQGEDGVRVWDAASGKELQHLPPEAGKIWGATDLSPDGKRIAAAIESSDGRIDIWDLSNGKKTGSFGEGYYALVRFSPDGKRLAVFSTAKAWLATVEVWDVASRRKLLSWKAHGGHQVMSLFFSPDSQTLFTCALDGKVRIWDAATGRQLREFTRLDWKLGVNSISPFNKNEALSPDGKLLALWEVNEKSMAKSGAVEWKARISLRDTTTGKQVRLISCPSQEAYPGQAPAFSALTFTPDGKKLLTGGPDRFLRVWDSATGDELQRWPLDFGRPYSLTPSRDGKMLAAVMNQGKAIQLLDMASGKPHRTPAGHLAQVYLAALTPDGRTAVTVGGDRNLCLWDVASSRIRRCLKGHEDGSLSALQLSPDGSKLYTVGWDKTVRVWDLNNGEERSRFQMGQEYLPSGYGALALSPDGGTLVVLGSRKPIHVIDTASGRELRRLQGPEWILGSAFAADGRSLVVWSGDLRARVWDVRKGHLLHEYPLPDELRIGQPIAVDGPSPTFYGAAVSPDGRLLAVGNRWHHLRNPKFFLVLKDLATGRDVNRMDNLPADANSLAFSPDGRILAWSGTKDSSIHLTETASGGERRRLPGHAAGRIHELAFSADGARLISGGSDTTALVWDVRDLAEHPPATVAEMEPLWVDLASADARRAYQAIRKLAAAPAAAVPFLRKRLRHVPAIEKKRLDRLIDDLDSDDFAMRQKATMDLEKIGERALAAYRKALEGKPSLETRRRLEDLRDKAQRERWDVSGERLRNLRAVEALELAGTKEAREVLVTLAAGASGARLTEEAKAALGRLARCRGNGAPS